MLLNLRLIITELLWLSILIISKSDTANVYLLSAENVTIFDLKL